MRPTACLTILTLLTYPVHAGCPSVPTDDDDSSVDDDDTGDDDTGDDDTGVGDDDTGTGDDDDDTGDDDDDDSSGDDDSTGDDDFSGDDDSGGDDDSAMPWIPAGCAPDLSVPAVTPFGSSCDAAPANVLVFTDRAAFDALLAGQVRVIGFDDVDTTPTDPVLITTDRYVDSHGALITGAQGAGQYVDETFLWTTDYVASSCPNLFSPGPAVAEDDQSGRDTVVTFRAPSGADGCVAGFGATFIDVDYPGIANSSIAVSDTADQLLHEEAGFSAGNAQALFRGLVTVDGGGQPVSGISSARLVNGNVWPTSNCCEGVVLDDFVLTGVVAQ